MEREIKAFGNYYKEFYDSLDAGAQEKVLYGMLLLKTQERLSKKYVKFIRDGLFELRILWEGNIVVVFNCFQKKTQKTPMKEIKNALQLKEAYYEQKRKNGIV